MAQQDSPRQTAFPRRVSAEELIALAEQIAVLAKAGVPMEAGLLAAARDLPGRANEVAAAMAERLAAGKTWHEVLREAPQIFEPPLRAVIEVGLQTGNLSIVLVCWSQTLRRFGELQRMARFALAYPLVIMTLAYVLFLASLIWWLPHYVALAQELRVFPPGSDEVAQRWTAWVLQYSYGPPLLAVLVWMAWRWWPLGGANARPRFLLPSLVRIGRLAHEAVFCDMLDQLIWAGVPLPQALPLAGQVSGSRSLRRDAEQVAEAIAAGAHQLPTATRHGVPPLIRLALLQQTDQVTLRQLLRRRAEWLHELVRVETMVQTEGLPLRMALYFGAVWVVLFAIWILGPWYWLLYSAATRGVV